MNSRERVQLSLAHQQPDRPPFDLGATNVTGIHIQALRRLRRHLGLQDDRPPEILNRYEQVGWVEEDLLERLQVDVEGVFPGAIVPFHAEDRGSDWYYRDEWQIGRRMPKEGGFYFDLTDYPLKSTLTLAELEKFHWPDPVAPARFEGMAERASQITHRRGRACIATGITAGIMETASYMRGIELFFSDLIDHRELIEAILDKIVALKMAYWEKALAILGDDVDVVVEADDLGAQNNLLISPSMYRSILKPRQRRLFDFIHSHTKARLFLHSCGAIHSLIPDLIDVGVDVLNPVQVSAARMDSAELKREFGKDITFWGGGVDTQHVLGQGTPNEVHAEVRRRITDFSPDGGFVFATVHCIQANVPPENIMAMIETLHS